MSISEAIVAIATLKDFSPFVRPTLWYMALIVIAPESGPSVSTSGIPYYLSRN